MNGWKLRGSYTEGSQEHCQRLRVVGAERARPNNETSKESVNVLGIKSRLLRGEGLKN